MAKLADLSGMKYGKLTVCEQAPSHYTPKGKPITMWKCSCECGNTVVVSGQSLRRCTTKSCGCILRQDLVGKQVGQLTVLKEVPSSKHRVRMWLCQCSCGNNVIKTTAELNSEHVKSCGHCRDSVSRVWNDYNWIYKPDHPHSSKGWIQEHIYVYEQTFGIPVKDGQVIHHINMDKNDNTPSNLFLCNDVSMHGRSHASINKLVQGLLEDGIVTFEDGQYHITEDKKR